MYLSFLTYLLDVQVYDADFYMFLNIHSLCADGICAKNIQMFLSGIVKQLFLSILLSFVVPFLNSTFLLSVPDCLRLFVQLS